MLKEVKSIDEKVRPAHKYFYAWLALAVLGAILFGVGGGIRSILFVILGGIFVAGSLISVFICAKIWEKAH